MDKNIDEWCALGISQKHLVSLENIGLILPESGAAFSRLQARASKAGFKLMVASGYRDYFRQLAIFNSKAKGMRKVVDDAGYPLQMADCSVEEWLHAILRFSALPGTSRHHWGTDFDVFDQKAVVADYQVQLEPEEYASGGPFAALTDWLTELIDSDAAEGFYRPYRVDRGGVAPEAWHISFRPIADEMASMVTVERLLQLWQCSVADAPKAPDERLALLDLIEPQIEAILARYVLV